MKSVIIIFFLCFSVACSAQKLGKIVKEVNRKNQKLLMSDSVLFSIQKENDLVIGYSVYSSWMTSTTEYFLVGFSKDKSIGYRYSPKLAVMQNEKAYELESFKVPEQNKDSILLIVKRFEFWKMNHSEKDEIYCPLEQKYFHCMIHDAASNDLIVMTKSRKRASSFYAPEYFEYECCAGDIDRQQFLTLKKVFLKLFSTKG
jgi:hypothetical protein